MFRTGSTIVQQVCNSTALCSFFMPLTKLWDARLMQVQSHLYLKALYQSFFVILRYPPLIQCFKNVLGLILAPNICRITSLLISLMGSLLISLMGSCWKVELKYIWKTFNLYKAKLILTLTRKVSTIWSSTRVCKWCKLALTAAGGLGTAYKIRSISTKIWST